MMRYALYETTDSLSYRDDMSPVLGMMATLAAISDDMISWLSYGCVFEIAPQWLYDEDECESYEL